MDNMDVQKFIKELVTKHMDELVTDVEGAFGRVILSNVEVAQMNAAVRRIMTVFSKAVVRR